MVKTRAFIIFSFLNYRNRKSSVLSGCYGKVNKLVFLFLGCLCIIKYIL